MVPFSGAGHPCLGGVRAGGREHTREAILRGFLDQLAGADFSISQAGYSTCANLLQTRVPAIVVPHEAMADQAERARLLAKHGLVRAIVPGKLEAARLAEAMREALGERMPTHELDLHGAIRSREILTSTEWPAISDDAKKPI